MDPRQVCPLALGFAVVSGWALAFADDQAVKAELKIVDRQIALTVEDNGRLVGIISDGDLRRLLERDGPDGLKKTAGDAMNPHPRTISAEELAVRALSLMEEKKITSLVAVNAAGMIQGVVHLHDLWETELI